MLKYICETAIAPLKYIFKINAEIYMWYCNSAFEIYFEQYFEGCASIYILEALSLTWSTKNMIGAQLKFWGNFKSK